ncbi:hypothetical protein, partial [Vibrio penaeicida]|uniref:hypothetical protein n=1 Tax=Vibrio penaeicida TaxID=104609 RepID=UPI0024E13238
MVGVHSIGSWAGMPVQSNPSSPTLLRSLVRNDGAFLHFSEIKFRCMGEWVGGKPVRTCIYLRAS